MNIACVAVAILFAIGFITCFMRDMSESNNQWNAECHARGGVNLDGHCYPKGTKEIKLP